MAEKISLKITENNNYITVNIIDSTKIELQNSKDFKAEMFNIINEQGFHRIILDLNNIEFIDSAGLGSLVSIFKQTRGHQDGKLVIINLSGHPKKLFKVTNMDRLFVVADSIDDAIKEFQS